MAVWPKGELVGSVNLLAPGTSVALDARAGDVLHFRTHVTAGQGSLVGTRGGQRGILDALHASPIVVTAADPGGRELKTTCTAYDNMSAALSDVGGKVTVTGANLECTLP